MSEVTKTHSRPLTLLEVNSGAPAAAPRPLSGAFEAARIIYPHPAGAKRPLENWLLPFWVAPWAATVGIHDSVLLANKFVRPASGGRLGRHLVPHMPGFTGSIKTRRGSGETTKFAMCDALFPEYELAQAARLRSSPRAATANHRSWVTGAFKAMHRDRRVCRIGFGASIAHDF